VIIGLLIWFNLISQVILLSASWIAIGVADDGIIVDPVLAEARARAERERAIAAAEAAADAARHRPWIVRLFSRRPHQKS
jgi:membrane protein